jgi:enoyl-CoA hydratase/carnithine racemase
MAAASERVTVEVTDHVAVVRMVRGDKHNALDSAMFVALDEAAGEVRRTPGVRAAVLCGEGPSFCSGLDFPSFMGGDAEIVDLFERRDGDDANLAQRVACEWQRLEVPVVAALHGACYGGGFQIALGADIRLAAPDTRMSVMEIRYGLVPDMGISRTLPSLVRADVAKELTFTGRIVGAREAHALGLVTRVAEDPDAAARELAGEIASKSPDAIRAAKRLLGEACILTPQATLRLETELQRGLLGSPNQAAAVQAAMSREPAKFDDPEPAGLAVS